MLFFDDLLTPIHMRNMYRLDHEIDDELLYEAWEKTKRVYPVVDAVLGFDEGEAEQYLDPQWAAEHAKSHLYIMAPEDDGGHPVKSKKPLAPNTEAVGKRLVAVSYYGNTICATAYHLLIDGGGFNMVLNTFLYTYLALYTGHEDEHPIVELREGRALEDYFVPMEPARVCAQDFTVVPLFEPPADVRGFLDEDMCNDEGAMIMGIMEIDGRDFMRLCKSTGANPSAMIAVLAGRAAYELNPDRQEGIVFGFTISSRDVLGVNDSIANAATGGVSYVTRSDFERKPLAEVAQRVRADLNAQRTRDYTLSFIKSMYLEHNMFDFVARPITYMGKFSIGDNDEHVLMAGISTKADANVYMNAVGDRFDLALQYGKATEKYLDEFAKIFAELGVGAKIAVPAHFVALDVKEPVL